MLTDKHIEAIIDTALKEDTGQGDITSRALLPADLAGKAFIIVKEEGILAGIDVARSVFQKIDPLLDVVILIEDGTPVKPGDIAAAISGSVTSILKAERVALNFLQRLSGIASLTAKYVAETSGTRAEIYDTRKTTPGLRGLEKYAVRMGGGKNHRLHLGDAVLIKDNHIAALHATGMSLPEIIEKARRNVPAGTTVEAEVTSQEEALDALKAGADIIMLDNMNPDEMRKTAGAIDGRVKIEASGKITLQNVREVAMTGVDIISIGTLTHSYQSLDISLEMELQALKLI